MKYNTTIRPSRDESIDRLLAASAVAFTAYLWSLLLVAALWQ